MISAAEEMKLSVTSMKNFIKLVEKPLSRFRERRLRKPTIKLMIG